MTLMCECIILFLKFSKSIHFFNVNFSIPRLNQTKFIQKINLLKRFLSLTKSLLFFLICISAFKIVVLTNLRPKVNSSSCSGPY